ncbi:MAG: hypothetical protein ACYC3F_05290 [Gemmatimonadaceae bacterium]
MLTPADRLVMLDVLYDLRVSLAPDGEHIDVTGPTEALTAATPMLWKYRADFVAHLRAPGSLQAVVGGVSR